MRTLSASERIKSMGRAIVFRLFVLFAAVFALFAGCTSKEKKDQNEMGEYAKIPTLNVREELPKDVFRQVRAGEMMLLDDQEVLGYKDPSGIISVGGMVPTFGILRFVVCRDDDVSLFYRFPDGFRPDDIDREWRSVHNMMGETTRAMLYFMKGSVPPRSLVLVRKEEYFQLRRSWDERAVQTKTAYAEADRRLASERWREKRTISGLGGGGK